MRMMRINEKESSQWPYSFPSVAVSRDGTKDFMLCYTCFILVQVWNRAMRQMQWSLPLALEACRSL